MHIIDSSKYLKYLLNNVIHQWCQTKKKDSKRGISSPPIKKLKKRESRQKVVRVERRKGDIISSIQFLR